MPRLFQKQYGLHPEQTPIFWYNETTSNKNEKDINDTCIYVALGHLNFVDIFLFPFKKSLDTHM